MPRTVIALFDDPLAADEAVASLLEAGFARDAIRVLATDETAGQQLAEEVEIQLPSGFAPADPPRSALTSLEHGLIAQGMTTGPEIGRVGADPPGGDVGGGGLASELTDLELDEEDVRLYASELEKGRIAVAVLADNDRERLVRELLAACGGTEIR